MPARTWSTSASATRTCRRREVAVEKLREAVREPAQPPLLVEPRHPEPATGDLRPLRAPLRRRARPGDAGADDDRRQGGARAPDVGARRSRATRRSCRARATRSTCSRRSSPARSSSGSPMGHDEDLFDERRRGVRAVAGRGRASLVLSFPHNPTTARRRRRLHAAGRRLRARARADRRPRLRLRRPRLRRPRAAVDPAGRGRAGGRGRAVHADEVVLDGRLARRLRRRQRRDRRGRSPG